MAGVAVPTLRNLDKIMKIFKVRRMTFPEDMPKMDDFIHKIFLPEIPMTHIFNVDSKPKVSYQVPLPYQPSGNSQDIYLKAIDTNGEMVGIAISKEHTESQTDPNTPQEWKQLMECFKFAEDKAQINNLPGKTMELFILSVNPEWRNLGVALRLGVESMVLARSAGFDSMKAICLNDTTAKMAKSQGFTELYRMAYMDYPKLSGANVTLKPGALHENMYILGVEL